LQLLVLLRTLGLTGDGVEIGVRTGHFSAEILNVSRLHCLFAVDPWDGVDDRVYVDPANITREGQERNYRETAARLARFGDRAQLLRVTSAEAAPRFPDRSLAFVYIDGNHSLAASAEDIALWWPKVRSGGILAGHDDLDGRPPEGDFGVKSAVDAFGTRETLPIFVAAEKWPTWYAHGP
jgi:hypothetical protein